MRPPLRFQGVMGGNLAAQLIPALEDIKYRSEPQISDTGEQLPKGLYLHRDPNYAYGDLVPLRKNKQTGEFSFALPGIMGGIIRSAQAPGRAARGEMVSDEDALEVGMNLLGGNQVITRGAVPAPGEMFAFGGRKAVDALHARGLLSDNTKQTFDKWASATRRPTNMEADVAWASAGVDPGFRFDGPRIELGGAIRFKVDPKQATKDYAYPAEAVLSNFEELRAAYPETADLKIAFRNGMGGSFNPKTKTIEVGTGSSPEDALNTLHHEIEHFVQDMEGFAQGTSSLMSSVPDDQKLPQEASWSTSRKLAEGILDSVKSRLSTRSKDILRGVKPEDQSQLLSAIIKGHDWSAGNYIDLDALGVTAELGKRNAIRAELVKQLRQDLESTGAIADIRVVDPYATGLTGNEEMKDILFSDVPHDVYSRATGENLARLAGVRSNVEPLAPLRSRPSAALPVDEPVKYKTPGNGSFGNDILYPQEQTYIIPPNLPPGSYDYNWKAFEAKNPEYMAAHEIKKAKAQALVEEFRRLAKKWGVQL